ncbi:MAG: hypothetical protein ACLQVX_06395 [Limisphaerales bacterium]
MHRNRRQAWNCRLALVALLAAGSGLGAFLSYGQEPLPPDLTNDFKVHLWNYGADMRGLMGYKENVFLSHTNRQDSPFWDSGGDFLFYRLPSGNWSLNGLLSGDDIRYFGGQSPTHEETALAVAQATGSFGEHWTSTLGANYAYQDQVMDLNAIEPGQAGTGRVIGNTFTTRSSARGQYAPGWAELGMDGTRQLLQSPLDSYWQFGPKLSLGHAFGPRDDLTLSYLWTRLSYDHDPDLDPRGNILTNTHLVLASQTLQLAWRRAWDERSRWRSTLTASYGFDQDNASGFFDRDQYSLASKLEYRAGAWSLSASTTAGAAQYPVQTVPLDGHDHRSKLWFSARARAEWRLTKMLKLQANFSFDRAFSNLDIDDYFTHTISIGAEFQF